MPTFIALLRGINVGGNRKVPMADLRALCADAGFGEARTYIQSGNVVFAAKGKTTALERSLEQALARRFDFAVDVVVRGSRQWSELRAANPFVEASASTPNHVLVGFAKRPLPADLLARLRPRLGRGEDVAVAGDALWIHYRGGIADSKLTPATLDRAAGSPVTARNWRTVLALAELAGIDA